MLRLVMVWSHEVWCRYGNAMEGFEQSTGYCFTIPDDLDAFWA